jgi:hypothetical protein
MTLTAHPNYSDRPAEASNGRKPGWVDDAPDL